MGSDIAAESTERRQRDHHLDVALGGELVDPAPSDRIIDGVAAKQIPEPVDSPDTWKRLRLQRKNSERAIESSRAFLQRISIRKHDLLVEIDAGRVDPGSGNQSSQARRQRRRIDAYRRRLYGPCRQLWNRADSVIAREYECDPRRITELEQRIEKNAEVSVKTQDVVVHLPRVWSEAVAYQISR